MVLPLFKVRDTVMQQRDEDCRGPDLAKGPQMTTRKVSQFFWCFSVPVEKTIDHHDSGLVDLFQRQDTLNGRYTSTLRC